MTDFYNRPTGCADYYAIYEDGRPYISKESQVLVPGDSLSGTFEISFDADKKIINGTARILVIPQQVKEIAPDGKARPVAFDQLLDGGPVASPGRIVENRSPEDIATFLEQEKRRIEGGLNQNGYYLTLAKCSRGTSCGCRIPVRFNVDLIAKDDGRRIDKTVYLYPKVARANSGNWAEAYFFTDKSGMEWPLTNHTSTHEVGHVFGFPDEYYDQAGVVHGRYVKDKQFMIERVSQYSGQPVWQGETQDTLMGGGIYKSIAQTPPYYLGLICRWFQERNGETWVPVASKVIG